MFLILIALALAQHISRSAALVVRSFSTQPPNFVPIIEPHLGRSVWDIVWSGLATTLAVAVTWTSVRLNAPLLEEGNWTLLNRWIFLMCLALLALVHIIMWPIYDEGTVGRTMSTMFYSEGTDLRPLFFISVFASAAFGSIHCAAWSFDFPSPVERILWRTVFLSIVGVCLGVAGHLLSYKLRHSAYRSFRAVVVMVLQTIFATVYSLSRSSILILAIISLHNLPDSAFETVTWTNFIPHV